MFGSEDFRGAVRYNLLKKVDLTSGTSAVLKIENIWAPPAPGAPLEHRIHLDAAVFTKNPRRQRARLTPLPRHCRATSPWNSTRRP